MTSIHESKSTTFPAPWLVGSIIAFILAMVAVLIWALFFSKPPTIQVRSATTQEIQAHQVFLLGPSDIMVSPTGWRITADHNITFPSALVTVTIKVTEQTNGNVVLLPTSNASDCHRTLDACMYPHQQYLAGPGGILFIQISREAMLYQVGNGHWGHSEVFEVAP